MRKKHWEMKTLIIGISGKWERVGWVLRLETSNDSEMEMEMAVYVIYPHRSFLMTET